ncbi:putative NBD/HSP70 family sugar kinase [Granulicella aggregans]|uniref:Putative NBD/HSP70 family sugar kinase n=1 Tax=Granulicella aggregans TaxID=474949 RepID=A0A7W8E4I6_9BACT|nr:hypothetical protein [Granulicella aggregans]MBB5058546.1 putative NBD/HSP70 family sugar kinase [Granulicella aggregans]
MRQTELTGTGLSVRIANLTAATIFLVAAMIAGYRYIGWPPVIIVGGSGSAALVLWSVTYLRRPMDPEYVLPPFLLAVAALEVHMIEEYLTGFGPAMSRLFNISWSERSFLMIFAFIGPILYTLTALGLFRRVPIAGFLMCFIFIGPGIAEFTHFIFPALRPDVQPTVAASVQAIVGRGQLMQNLPNFWVDVTGRYYFPGMYTAILPMIPGIWGVRRLVMRRLAATDTSAQKDSDRSS